MKPGPKVRGGVFTTREREGEGDLDAQQDRLPDLDCHCEQDQTMNVNGKRICLLCGKEQKR